MCVRDVCACGVVYVRRGKGVGGWATTSTASSGNGHSNNRIFGSTSDNQTAPGAQNAAIGDYHFLYLRQDHEMPQMLMYHR